MYEGYRVVIVTPAGRRRFLRVLERYVMANRPLVDEWQLWENTRNEKDLCWMVVCKGRNPEFVRLVPPDKELPEPPEGQDYRIESIGHFFRGCVKRDTIYIRLDDDICWIAPEALERLLGFRVRYPEYLLVFGNTINNGVCSWLHQRAGVLPVSHGELDDNALNPLGYKDGKFARFVHEWFLSEHLERGNWDAYKFHGWRHRGRFSVNAFAFFGCDFDGFNGEVSGGSEEHDLSVKIPDRLGRENCICGDALFVHFAFGPQLEYLEENTDLLEQYEQASREIVTRTVGTIG